jgi:hypothetical protein
LLQFITIMLFHRVGINYISLGPMAVLFSILYQYSRIIPPAYTYRVFGIPLNNKSMNYILAFQVSVHPISVSSFMGNAWVEIKSQFAISRPLGSVAVALIGILTGQIYRSDLAGLNAYRLPPTIIWFSKGFIAPVIGSLRPPRRSNRALPDDFRDTSRVGEPSTTQNEEVITTARPPGSLVGRARGGGSEDEQRPAPSVMREWVEELTRRDHADAGLRVPSETEITHLTSMFPSLDREVVVGALQRR